MDRTIPIAQSDQIPTVQRAYLAVVAIGGWLPWVALIFLTAGVLVARRRSVALVWAAAGLGVSMLLLVLGFGIGRNVLLTAVPPVTVPSGVTTLLYDTATAAMQDTAVIGVVLAVAIAVVAWFAGPFKAPRRLRGFYTDAVAGLRHNAEQHGVTTGRVGNWVYAQRRVLHVIIALGRLGGDHPSSSALCLRHCRDPGGRGDRPHHRVARRATRAGRPAAAGPGTGCGLRLDEHFARRSAAELPELRLRERRVLPSAVRGHTGVIACHTMLRDSRGEAHAPSTRCVSDPSSAGPEIKASDQAKAVALVMLVLPVPKVEGVRACCRRSDNFCP